METHDPFDQSPRDGDDHTRPVGPDARPPRPYPSKASTLHHTCLPPTLATRPSSGAES